MKIQSSKPMKGGKKRRRCSKHKDMYALQRGDPRGPLANLTARGKRRAK